jgi:NAD(P)-dependent dehydrogenase (short-subunit alcohol dehydrogenase family)
MAGRLAGKIALVTGTAGGQGRAAALLFAAEGAKVIGCDLKVDEDRETVAMVKAKGGEMVSLTPTNLSNEDQVKALIDFAVTSFGDFDIVYNNASAARGAPADELTLENWMFSLNNELTNMFLMNKHVLEVFKRKGGGVILNTASVAGIVGAGTPGNVPVHLAHNVTKAGVIRMSQHLAIEYSPWNIRVNSVSPGVILTPATGFWVDAIGEDAFTDLLLVKRLGQPEDIAKAALFLVSDDASYITGANLVVDGGWVASGGLGRPNPELSKKFAAIIDRYRTSTAGKPGA